MPVRSTRTRKYAESVSPLTEYRTTGEIAKYRGITSRGVLARADRRNIKPAFTVGRVHFWHDGDVVQIMSPKESTPTRR